MVTVKRPTSPMMSSSPSSDEREAEDSQQDAIPPRDAMEALGAIAAAHSGQMADSDGGGRSLETGKQFWSATVDTALDAAASLQIKVKEFSGKMAVPPAIREAMRMCSIKFVAVIGLTGAGKSSIIKTLTGEDVHVGHSIDTGTTTIEMFPTIIDEQCYVLIDTPGFNDQDRSDMEVFEEILEWLHALTPYCDLAGILYIHNIDQNRFNQSVKLNLDMLKALSGEKFFKQVTILTTMWGNMNARTVKAAEKRQARFEQGPWKTLIDGGARVFAHRQGVAEPEDPVDEEEKGELENQRKLAREELEEIMSYHKTSERVTPRIQKELRAKADIWSTEAGGVLQKNSNLPPTPSQIASNGTTALNSPSCQTDESSAIPQSSHSPGKSSDSGNETPTPQTRGRPKESKGRTGKRNLLDLSWILFLFSIVTFFLRKRS